MDIKKLLMDLETHPVIVAIAFFLVVFVGYNLLKKNSNSTATIPTATPPGYTGPQSESYSYTYYPVQTIPNPQPTPIAPVLPPNPIPVKPPSPVHCDVEKFHACIAQYNHNFPKHKPGAAHNHCWSLMPECKGVR